MKTCTDSGRAAGKLISWKYLETIRILLMEQSIMEIRTVRAREAILWKKATFSDEYHVFNVEWEPGQDQLVR